MALLNYSIAPLYDIHYLHSLLHTYNNYLVIGDFNQVGKYDDKLDGSSLIRGWDDFIAWKHDLHLQDIPFLRPSLHLVE